MIFFVYTAESDDSISKRLGLADYSYFFVMKTFLPVLARLGRVIRVAEPADLKAQFAAQRAAGRAAVVLAFTPPHRTPIDLQGPTLPVFAWEYSSIPDEAWGNDERHNWAQVLRGMVGAITHSSFAVAAVRAAVGQDYPIVSLPAPLWDNYARLYRSRKPSAQGNPWQLQIVSGIVLDSHAHGLQRSHIAATPAFVAQRQCISLRGIVYTAVLNPNDARKNWVDTISAFCFAFRDNPDATLIMKLVYCDSDFACSMLWHEMKKLAPYQCRVIAVQGYLDDREYRRLVANSTYIVNSAYGEGQCLPLMEFMSAGKPAIAPNHTAMIDYIDEANAFIVLSSPEWTHWPHDPRLVLRAFRYRIDWQSLRDAYIESYRVAASEPSTYLRMSRHATEALRAHCSRAVIRRRFKQFLQEMGYSPSYRPLVNGGRAMARRLIIWLRRVGR